MQDWNRIEDVLDFAISEEEEAAIFYTEMAKKASTEWMKEAFKGFAKEEQGHKAKLESIKSGGKIPESVNKKVLDLKIGDYLIDVKPSADMDHQEALILAMKKEKAAFKLYSDLAQIIHEEDIKQVFLMLAQEEAKHKLRFEIQYDDEYLKEN